MNLADFSQDIIRSRTLLRTNRRKSARVVELTVWYLSTVTGAESEPHLNRKVRAVYQQIYGIDPITLWILGLIINIIVKIIIEWWMHRDENPERIQELRCMQTECTSLQRLMQQKGIM